jgi:hypothetical protein
MNIGNNLVALQYHEQALRMRESKLGRDHADVAATKDNMGLVYRQLNQLDMALKVAMAACHSALPTLQECARSERHLGP